jgi:hypothetical protein
MDKIHVILITMRVTLTVTHVRPLSYL